MELQKDRQRHRVPCGKTYSARQTQYRFTLTDGTVIEANGMVPLHVTTDDGKTTTFVLYKVDKGQIGEKLSDLPYVKTLVFKSARNFAMIRRMANEVHLVANAAPRKSKDFFVLLLLLVIAGSFRLPELTSPGYTLDELWTAEIASSRGSMHFNFPVNQVLQPPEFFTLNNAPPWWKVWSRMEVTHPPLYFILLRIWMGAFGEGDGVERLFSIVSSLAAIAFLFDAARLKNGQSVAFWASLLMVVAPLQIDYARKTRNYALVLLTILAVADALVRIETLGMSRRRLLGLLLGVLAAPLTHYFSIGAIIGLAMYACIQFRGRTRRLVLSMFLLAAVIYLIIWGPFFYGQRALFSLEDSSTHFMKDFAPGHAWRVFNLAALVPAKMLVPRLNLNITAYLLALLYVVPLFLIHRRPELLLWGLWLLCSVGALTLMDLCRSSVHLGFVRYVIFAAPPVFVLIPAIALATHIPPWIAHALSAAAVALCLCFVRDGYSDPATDPRFIAQIVRPAIGPSDIVAFASNGQLFWTRGTQAMMLTRYIKPIVCPVVFLDAPPTGNTRETMLAARSIIIFSSVTEPEAFLPGFTMKRSIPFYYWGNVSVFVPTH